MKNIDLSSKKCKNYVKFSGFNAKLCTEVSFFLIICPFIIIIMLKDLLIYSDDE